jgi:hypothetical protein
MQDDYTNAMRVLEAWKRVVYDLRWTHWLNFNPCVPDLKEHEVELFGGQVADRIRDRLALKKGMILLVPELSAGGLWHYHGFASVPDERRGRLIEVNGERWAIKRMNSLIDQRYSAGRANSIQPTAVIQSRTGSGIGAQTYAMKNGLLQDKASGVIWR